MASGRQAALGPSSLAARALRCRLSLPDRSVDPVIIE